MELNWHCSEATTESQCSAPETKPKSKSATTARLHKQVLSAGLRWLSDAEAVEAVKQNAKERGNDTDFDKLVNLASFLFLLPFIAHLQLRDGSDFARLRTEMLTLKYRRQVNSKSFHLQGVNKYYCSFI